MGVRKIEFEKLVVADGAVKRVPALTLRGNDEGFASMQANAEYIINHSDDFDSYTVYKREDDSDDL